MVSIVRRFFQTVRADLKTSIDRFPASCIAASGLSFFAFMIGYSKEPEYFMSAYCCALFLCAAAELRMERIGVRRLYRFAAALGAAACFFLLLLAAMKSELLANIVCLTGLILIAALLLPFICMRPDIGGLIKSTLKTLLRFFAMAFVSAILWSCILLLMYLLRIRSLFGLLSISIPMYFTSLSLPMILVLARLPKLPK